MRNLFPLFLAACLLSACSANPPPDATPVNTLPAGPPATVSPTQTPTALPPRQLTICTGREPASLFLYGDDSQTAQSIRQALYDGPIDHLSGSPAPVILEELPSLANGGASLQAVQVPANYLIVNSQGELVNLGEGVSYFPSGCTDPGCAVVYSGSDPVTMDRLVVRYRLRPGMQWQDGTALSAADSLFSYSLARSLQPGGQIERLRRTADYRLVDENTIEWIGLPGWLDPQYLSNYFTPQPQHLLGLLEPAQVLTSTLAARQPLGWGAYLVEDWSSGKQIGLIRNPLYWRAAEGLPHFDRLVFQYYSDPGQAVLALQAGECDILDPSLDLSPADPRLAPLLRSGKAAQVEIPGTAWEHLDFGVNSVAGRIPYFQSRQVRQAVAQCIDRQKLAEMFNPGQPTPDSYVPPGHPLVNPGVRQYGYDPAAAAALLDSAGWRDADNDPTTPRTALGAPGAPDGAPFIVTLLTSAEPDRQLIAQSIQESLAACGIQVELSPAPAGQVFAPGPAGPVFGRQFDLAQFAWPASAQPACWLYTTSEIPGPSPQHPKGWGGANLSGYTNPQYDQACQQALNSLPDGPGLQSAHWQAQAIFAEDLPAVPLFSRSEWLFTRPDLCGLDGGSPGENSFWSIEEIDYGDGCSG